jgi:multidrug efflux pump subunit AcrB
LTQPLIVGLPIPFALIGVIWALKLHDLPLSLMSMIGLIGTLGVAVNDSIVMVDHINRLWRTAGKKTTELVIDGAASRLRAISLTASCTLVGVFPTAYGIGGESGFTQPLAFSMGWGLLTSLLLTLFIIPAMLMILEDTKGLLVKIKQKFTSSKKKIATHETTTRPLPPLEI